jgi:hypothetical protein
MNVKVGQEEDGSGGLGRAIYKHFEDKLPALRQRKLTFREREMLKDEPEEAR